MASKGRGGNLPKMRFTKQESDGMYDTRGIIPNGALSGKTDFTYYGGTPEGGGPLDCRANVDSDNGSYGVNQEFHSSKSFLDQSKADLNQA